MGLGPGIENGRQNSRALPPFWMAGSEKNSTKLQNFRDE
jgi:hypothetical protein